jgi:hypothetical protein
MWNPKRSRFKFNWWMHRIFCEMWILGKILNSRGGVFSELLLHRTGDFEPNYIEIILTWIPGTTLPANISARPDTVRNWDFDWFKEFMVCPKVPYFLAPAETRNKIGVPKGHGPLQKCLSIFPWRRRAVSSESTNILSDRVATKQPRFEWSSSLMYRVSHSGLATRPW